jgi:hypothetical protein
MARAILTLSTPWVLQTLSLLLFFRQEILLKVQDIRIFRRSDVHIDQQGLASIIGLTRWMPRFAPLKVGTILRKCGL